MQGSGGGFPRDFPTQVTSRGYGVSRNSSFLDTSGAPDRKKPLDRVGEQKAPCTLFFLTLDFQSHLLRSSVFLGEVQIYLLRWFWMSKDRGMKYYRSYTQMSIL